MRGNVSIAGFVRAFFASVLFVAAIAGIPRAALAVTWNAALTDTFNRPGEVGPSGTANAYSGYGINNGWQDLTGGQWTMNTTGTVRLNNATSVETLGKYLLQEAAITPNQNERIVATTEALSATTASFAYGVVIRAQSSNLGTTPVDSYYASITPSGVFGVYKVVAGVSTLLLSNTINVTLVQGDKLSIDFSATGDGATTTTLTAVLTDVTANNVLTTQTVTDTTGEFQSGGRVGLAGNTSGGGYYPGYTNVVVYNDGTISVLAPTTILGVGDSITWGKQTKTGPTFDIMVRILNASQSTIRYQAINCGQTGSTTANWLPTASPDLIDYAVNMATALNAKYITLELGSNDTTNSVTAATYLTNMQTIIAYLQSKLPGVPIILNQTLWFDYPRYNAINGSATKTAAMVALVSAYNAQLPSLVSSGVRIGNTSEYAFAQAQDYGGLYDGLHPNDIGAPQLASLWASAFSTTSAQGGSRFVRRF